MDQFSFNAILPAWPEVFVALGGMGLLMIGVFRGDRS
jgi:hypothetical protein